MSMGNRGRVPGSRLPFAALRRLLPPGFQGMRKWEPPQAAKISSYQRTWKLMEPGGRVAQMVSSPDAPSARGQPFALQFSARNKEALVPGNFLVPVVPWRAPPRTVSKPRASSEGAAGHSPGREPRDDGLIADSSPEGATPPSGCRPYRAPLRTRPESRGLRPWLCSAAPLGLGGPASPSLFLGRLTRVRLPGLCPGPEVDLQAKP